MFDLAKKKEEALRRILVKTWHMWERLGFYLVPKHFYYPIPETRKCLGHDFDREFPLEGISLDDDEMCTLLGRFAEYKGEYEPIYRPTGYESNGDGSILYSMIRHLKPGRIIEIGSGNSTRVACQAMKQNEVEGTRGASILAIEPFPSSELIELAEATPQVQLLIQPVEEAGLHIFHELSANDILFIDSSHILKPGNDVYHLYLHILPQVPVGTMIHIHDIRFPQDHPAEWPVEFKFFWNEQYLLQMFLSYNDSYKIEFAGNYMWLRHAEEMKRSLVGLNESPDGWPGSFWLRRIK